MRYDMQAKMFSIVFSNLAKKYYKKHFPDINVAPLIKDVKKEYKQMVLRTPDIGGNKQNSMQSNLVGACYFFAMAKKIPNMTPELMDDMVIESMKSDFMVKINKKKREKGLMFSQKEHVKKNAEAIRSQSSNYEMDWTYTYKGDDENIFFNFTKCGVCRLAQKENLLDYLPCMCKMDYPKFEVAGAKLIRTKTLAKGDDCCDFHLCRIHNNK